MLDFRILGPLEVRRDGEPVEVTGRRQKALLVLLLLEANRVVSNDRLVDALWGEEPPPAAGAALRNAIVQLRRVLGQETIEHRDPGYVLVVPPESVDLARFERRTREARERPAARRSELLREALAEWRGPPLPELVYDRRLELEVRRLEGLRVKTQADAFDAELELGQHAQLVPELEALVAEHPHDERLVGQLMLALYRSGRQNEALGVYRDARRRLAEDGVEPSPQLRQLHSRILQQDPSLEQAAPAAAGRGPDDDHLLKVAEAVLAGRVVPVLASLEDLAPHLAQRFRYPAGGVLETPRVAQYAAAVLGYGPLHDELRTLVDAAAEPQAVHRFFASLPPLLRERGVPQQLIVTSDYDGALERAFAEAGEEVDVVAYLATGRDRGRFCHIGPDGSAHVINDPSEYAVELSLERRPVILRVRGRADATPDRELESFVVTEDDHIDYLGRANVPSGIPVALAGALRRSHFLFLGYSMSDWCLRLVLGRIWTEVPSFRSWAVHPAPGPAEAELWRRFDVQLVPAELEPYIEALREAVGT
jgi:DNA-binding SARP family transcriptional activator